jgi:hypothetical protein
MLFVESSFKKCLSPIFFFWYLLVIGPISWIKKSWIKRREKANYKAPETRINSQLKADLVSNIEIP